MAKGSIMNREQFLQQLKSRYANPDERVVWQRSHFPKSAIYEELETRSLVDVFASRASFIHAELVMTDKGNVAGELASLCEGVPREEVIASKDPRFAEYGIAEWADETVTWWGDREGNENIAQAANSKIGITFADAALAESGTVLLLNQDGKGRSVSLLPETHIVLIDAKTIVPRMTEAMKVISEVDRIPSCVNFISGPSNSADIESYLVVGVHGPLRVVYVVIE